MGYYFPAEFDMQRAMWLSWPHKEASWPGKLDLVYDPYCEFLLRIADHQQVCINVANQKMQQDALDKIIHSKYARPLEILIIY